MNRSARILLLLLAAALAAGAWHFRNANSSTESLTVYCAANLRKPVETIAEQYRKEIGVQVHIQPSGSGTLLSQIQVAKRGDIFIAADDGTVADAAKKDLIREVLPLVAQRPVIAVAKGNPKSIRTFADLLRPDVRLSLADPGAASISKVSRKLLGEKWDALLKKATVMKTTVSDVANDVQLHAVDAGIVWDSTVTQFKDIEAVELPELGKHRENASAAILSFAAKPSEALKFARYLSAPDRGGKTFAQAGFTLAGGDRWAATPEMILYSGGVNRLAIEKLLHQFSEREGVTVTTVFNGCGILCAAMKTMGDSSNPKFPDAYYACDVCFVPPVAKYFPEAVLMTETEIVIAVPKGNPKNIRTLSDLAQPGLRVGLSNADQATLGYMTKAILKEMSLYDSVMKNVVVQVPTSDFLINQMRAGGLDAAIVYRVNVVPQLEHFEIVALPADKAKAVQPFAVRGDSVNRRLSERLLAFLKANKGAFEEAGFMWTGEGKPVPTDKLNIPEWLRKK